MVSGMARPSKGDRVVTVSRIQRPVWEHVHAEADRQGISISAYIADVLASHAGRPDLICELDRHQGQEGLPLAV